MLANAFQQSALMYLTHHIRQRAGSYRFEVIANLGVGSRSIVGARLPAIAVGQPYIQSLTLHIRGQARSYM